MVVTLNAAGAQQSQVSGVSFDYTGLTVAAGSNRGFVAVVAWHFDPGAVTVKNWDQAGTPQALEILQAPTANANGQFVAIYGLVAPTTGNKTLRLTWTNDSEMVLNVVAFDGVDQTGSATSFPNAATATDPVAPGTASATITITRPSNGAIVAVSVCGSANGHTSVSATQLLLYSGVGAIDAGGSYSLASGTYTGTLSGNDRWIAAAVGVAAAADAAVPFVTQLGSQMVTRGRAYSGGFYSFALGTALALSQAVPSTPFALSDWAGTVPPRPKAPVITNLTHVQARPLYYPEVKPFNQQAWPVPPQPLWMLLVTISTQPLDPTPPAINLPFRQRDWPLPTGRTSPIALRTWTQAPPKYYVETQPLAQFAWPLPRRAAVPHDRWSWTQSRVAGVPEVPLLPGPPFAQLEWPLPMRAKALPTARLGYIGYYALDEAAPLRAASALDLPPAPRPWPIGLRTWVQGRSLLLEDTVPFHQTDWPLPSRRLVAMNGVSTWQQGRSLLLLTDVLPFHQTDWPLPRGKETVISQRTWTQGVLSEASLSVAPSGWGPLRAMRRNRLLQRIV